MNDETTEKASGGDKVQALVRREEVEYRWYGEKPSPATCGETTWIPSCWARQTLEQAMALLEEDRFVRSGMLNSPLRLLREVKIFTEVARVSNDLNEAERGTKR